MANDDHELIRQNLLDECGNRRRPRGAVRPHKKVAVGMPLVALKRDTQIALGLVHDQNERPVRT
jgi:hypothetical protein